MNDVNKPVENPNRIKRKKNFDEEEDDEFILNQEDTNLQFVNDNLKLNSNTSRTNYIEENIEINQNNNLIGKDKN